MALSKEESRILRRKALFEAVFDHLQRQLLVIAPSGRVYLSEGELFNAVDSYFQDVERHKAFHNTERIDKPKQAAFTVKWLSKLRPIRFDCAPGDFRTLPLKILYANEIYALRCGCSMMGLKTQLIPRQMYKDALYALRYRPADERFLALWLAALLFSYS